MGLHKKFTWQSKKDIQVKPMGQAAFSVKFLDSRKRFDVFIG